MNIGLFSDTYLPQINGVVTSLEIFRKELEKKGHKIYIFCPRIGSMNNLPVSSTYLKRFISIPYFLQREYRIVFPLSSKLLHFSKYNLDVIHSHDFFPLGILAWILSKKFNIPHVHTYHTLWTEYAHYSFLPRGMGSGFLKWWSKIFCNSCDLIISPSSLIKNVLESYDVKTKIEIIPTGIDYESFTKSNGKKVREELHLSQKIRILSFAGRLGKEKNIYFLLRAFKLIQDKYPLSILLIIGDGPEKKSLIHFTQSLKLKGKILFLGYKKRNEVLSILSQSDLFVFPSKTETQGLSLLEALACGTPAVAIKAMGVADILKDDVGGYLVNDNEKEFADKVDTILKDNMLHKKKVEEAVKRAEEFSSSRMTEKLVKSYESVLNIPVIQQGSII
ncbi:MAG: glycosyltransferase family 4 protein [Spirochaetales bacterium]|nr:glycosyltransferase family 4 protein [Spirochaetales bacterium]